jgi:glucokinase
VAAAVTVGIDLGGTKCLGVAVDDRGRVVAEHRTPTPRGTAAVLDALAGVAAALVAEVGPVAAVGCGVPGLVDAGGRLRFAPNLPGVADLAVGDELSARLGVPVRVDNDANCAAWGEREAGAGRQAAHMVLVTLGTGIGGGLVSGGVLARGAHGFAGEVGHMVVDPHGPACPCGKRGCWERFASGSGLGRLGREAAEAGRAPRLVALAGGDPAAVRGEHVTQAAVEGDPAAIEVMRSFAWWVALGLSNLANLLDPELFVVAGGLVEAGEVLLGPVRAAFAELVEAAEHRPEVPILPAALGERAGAVGAALIARELL